MDEMGSAKEKRKRDGVHLLIAIEYLFKARDRRVEPSKDKDGERRSSNGCRHFQQS